METHEKKLLFAKKLTETHTRKLQKIKKFRCKASHLSHAHANLKGKLQFMNEDWDFHSATVLKVSHNARDSCKINSKLTSLSGGNQ